MTLAKPIAVYLKLVAAAVVIHFCIYPFYGPGERAHDPDNVSVWLVLDWFMAAALAVLLFTTWQRRAAAEPDDRSARGMFVAAVALTIAFLPNWFHVLLKTDDTNWTIWYLIDVAMPILLWTEGHRLWQAPAQKP